MKIVIVGNGVWGNALYSMVSQNAHNVTIAKKGEKIKADIIVLAVPTSSIKDVLPLITFLQKRIIVNTSKGIEKNTHRLPNQIVNEIFGNSIHYFTLMGPSFAEEVTQKMPTLVNLGYHEQSDNLTLTESLFQTNYFRVRPTKGVETLEIAGALKNVYAIACGIAEGLGYRTNTKTQLITLAIEELYVLFKGLGIHVDSGITPELIGDLILTCTSGSRNFNFGKLLVSHTTTSALEQIGSTVEGVNTVESINYLGKKGKASLPIGKFVKQVIHANNPSSVLNMFNDFLKSL